MKKNFLLIMFLIATCGFLLENCKVPYEPPLKTTQTHFLVVEGFIDGSSATVIKVSRTRMLSAKDTAAPIPELNASVIVEDDQNNQYPLAGVGDGSYTSNGLLNLNPSNKYRVHIVTAGGKEYASDLVEYKPSPEIDRLGWKLKDGGVQVFVNTHDQNDKTIYYRWEYKETWEFHARYHTTLLYLPATDQVVPRTDQVFVCWRSTNFTNILLGSSAKLTHDVIEEAPLVFIPEHSDKLSVLYSILVKQYPLDVDAYNYWVAMRNNTEKVGSIFDPQPNQTTGNIHSLSNPAEVVVGFVNAGTTVEKRFFIKNSELPRGWNLSPLCDIKEVPEDSTAFYFTAGYAPINESIVSGKKSYTSSYLQCVDCTLQGTNVKPDFWP